jgi:hypothetical protein
MQPSRCHGWRLCVACSHALVVCRVRLCRGREIVLGAWESPVGGNVMRDGVSREDAGSQDVRLSA